MLSFILQFIAFLYKRVTQLQQRYQKKLGDAQLASLIKSSARPADQRQREIENWMQEADINKDPVRLDNHV